MAPKTAFILVALVSAAAAASHGRLRASLSCPPLLKLRGGAVTTSYGRPISSYSQYSREMAVPVERQPVQVEQPESMSDAERVFVLQQFSRQAVRKAFIKRVYAIVATQLAATAGVVALLRSAPHVPFLLLRQLGPFIFFLPAVVLLALQWVLATRGSSTLAYLLLTAFTVTEGAVIGVATLPLPLTLILRAAAAAALATGGISLYALTTKRDFTMMGGMLGAGLLSLIMLGIAQYIFGGSWLTSVRLAFGTLLFSFFLLYNTQQMMGGGKQRQVRPTEHLLAAVQIYTDIINLFMHILASMAREQRD
uniref:Uncharacterized protein n=1 Tax=Haptolina brevifila TaxID=156173 RepID=A0A7S2N0T8_9EUKA|mmetsp:Transcript_63599/g.125786  ORF Transcript_63599/g.125786 Transcript_63599/m.125786 type:complete len:308 (+) Transcript_63599:170-1093(+)